MPLTHGHAPGALEVVDVSVDFSTVSTLEHDGQRSRTVDLNTIQNDNYSVLNNNIQ